VLDATPAGGMADLGTCVYAGPAAVATIAKPVTLLRGVIKPTGFDAVSIRSNDVTIDGTTFDGGGWTIRIFGVDRTTVRRSTFVNMRETSISLVGPSVDDTLIEGNTIVQSVVTGASYSPISGSGPGGTNRSLVIRGNSIDNGPGGVAHFGIEVWDNTGLLIEGNDLKGAGALLSIPRSNGAIVRSNTLDLTQAYWGMEIATMDNAQIVNNVAAGVRTDQQWRALVQLHPGGGTVNGTLIAGNRLTNYAALLNAPPAPPPGKVAGPTTVRDNCLQNVGRVFWGTFAGPAVLTNNGPCA
jgi:hypothetical protein